VARVGKTKRKLRASADRIVDEGRFLQDHLGGVQGPDSSASLFKPLLVGIALGFFASHFLRDRAG